MTLPPEQMQKVYAIQQSMFEKFRNVPKEGRMVEYLGKEFIVYPGVFWPGEDSKAIVKNYQINPGEDVCDVCTGSGVIAIHSFWRGAKKVVALDINPNAIAATEYNRSWYRRNNREKVIEARVSDVFSALNPGEQFDVVTMNSPFTVHAPERGDVVERGCWDSDLHVHKEFYGNLDRVLKPHNNARAYVSQANFGAIEAMHELAKKAGFNVKEIGKNVVDDLRTFYAFELRRMK